MYYADKIWHCSLGGRPGGLQNGRLWSFRKRPLRKDAKTTTTNLLLWASMLHLGGGGVTGSGSCSTSSKRYRNMPLLSDEYLEQLVWLSTASLHGVPSGDWSWWSAYNLSRAKPILVEIKFSNTVTFACKICESWMQLCLFHSPSWLWRKVFQTYIHTKDSFFKDKYDLIKMIKFQDLEKHTKITVLGYRPDLVFMGIVIEICCVKMSKYVLWPLHDFKDFS